MSRSRWQAFVGLMLLLAAAPMAWAQQRQNSPHIGYVYPAGGRQGTTFQVTVGGQFLDGSAGAYISGSGVKATVIEHVKPITQREFNLLRDKLDQLTEKRRAAQAAPARGAQQGQPSTRPAWTAEDEQEVAEIRKKLATFQRRPASPAIVEKVTVEITLAPDAAPGERELRLATTGGLTNPLVFHVSQLPELVEGPPRNSTASAEQKVTLPATLNGQIMPGEVDRYRFAARKGQRLVVDVRARALIPYIADAVPGWFQAVVSLHDAHGNEVAFADDYRFDPDPVLHYLVPADGEYILQIRDSIYRGREDFVYRVSVGELPFITSIFPLGATVGAKPAIEMKGWNLPLARLMSDTATPGMRELTARRGVMLSNRVPFIVDELPDAREQEPNDAPAAAQALTLPIIINGRIDRPGDWDIFRFEGKTGMEITAEVNARRLHSPLDSMLKLTDAAGRQIAFNDDCEDKALGLHTHHADSRLRAVLPASGDYYVHIGDAQNKGGPECAYRLRISEPWPDYELRIVPSSITVRPGSTVAFTVHALRRDGFAGDIALELVDAPAGFKLGGARIPGGVDRVQVTLTAPAAASDEPAALNLRGKATAGGRDIVRPAIPADDMMQAFAYRHLVPAAQFAVLVAGRPVQRNLAVAMASAPALVRLPAGGTARVTVALPANTGMGKVKLELADAPEGITIRNITATRTGTEITLHADPGKVKPGAAGNLIFTASQERPGNDQPPTRRRTPLGMLPAVPFEVVEK